MSKLRSETRSVIAGIDPGLLAAIPAYRRTVLVCSAGSVGDVAGGAARVRAALDRAAAHWAGFDVASHPTVAQWRDAFKEFGISTRKYRPSPEAMLRRASRGEPVGTGQPLIDLGCAVSLATALPVGIHAVEPWMQGLTLRPAQAGDTFTPMSGEIETPDPGEVVYASGTTVLTRRWVWRQGVHGSITASGPWDLAINIDSLGDDSHDHAVDLTTALLTHCDITEVSIVALGQDSPAALLTWDRDCGNCPR